MVSWWVVGVKRVAVPTCYGTLFHVLPATTRMHVMQRCVMLYYIINCYLYIVTYTCIQANLWGQAATLQANSCCTLVLCVHCRGQHT